MLRLLKDKRKDIRPLFYILPLVHNQGLMYALKPLMVVKKPVYIPQGMERFQMYNKDVSTRQGGLYSLFIPMEWNMEGFIDEHGFPVFDTPKKPVMGIDGELIEVGVIDYWNNEVESMKSDADALNEYYRQFPRTESHAFRDESKSALFNLTKIYQQVDYNDSLINARS